MYVLIDCKGGDSWEYIYDDLSVALRDAEDQWERLTSSEQRKREMFVVGETFTLDNIYDSLSILIDFKNGFKSCEVN